MIVRLHRLRDRGQPIPRYRFAFIPPIEGELVVSEGRDAILNRTTRIARLIDRATGSAVQDCPPLLDVQLVGMTRETLSLSGIERFEDVTIARIEDFAQSWLCWLPGATDAPGS